MGLTIRKVTAIVNSMRIVEKSKDFPVIYLRYYDSELLYIGESHSCFSNRHLRTGDDAGPYDKVIVLKACKNTKRRKYWEAFLISKKRPANQNFIRYDSVLKKANGKKINRKWRPRGVEYEKATKKEILYAAYVRLDQFKKLIDYYKS